MTKVMTKTYTLKNGIKVILQEAENTPRVAVDVFINSGVKEEPKAGIATLAAKLLTKGTTTRSSENIADDLDVNAILMAVETKKDCIKIASICLNEDLGKTLELLEDIIKNPTFENFEKEATKLKGEIEADLDSVRTKVMDKFAMEFYGEHPYGNSHTRILEALPTITKEEVKEFYFLNLNKINIVAVGDFKEKELLKELEEKFASIELKDKKEGKKTFNAPTQDRLVTVEKNDAAQAHIVQGWEVEALNSKDTAAMLVLNTLLGTMGLSSRLFVELRDKKGLAYHVRSSYNTFLEAGNFTVYIGTAPVNIKTSIDGFKFEIKRLMTEPVSDSELNDAKNNILGRNAFYKETNSKIAGMLGFYDIMGLGIGYIDDINEKVKHITKEDLIKVANKYFSKPSLTAILAPQEYLSKL